MNFGRLWWFLLTDASFGSLRLWISEVFDFACLLAGLGRLRLLHLIFPLAFIPFLHLLSPFFLTCFVVRLASCFNLLCVDLSTSFRLFGLRSVYSRYLWLWALAVNSLGGLIIFRMLGAYVDSSGTLIPALWVHLSPLSGCRWTSLSLSALWSIIPASPVGLSLSLNVIALPTTYLL